MDLLSGLGQILGFGKDIFNSVMSLKNYQYQKDTQQTAWERENNAVQRRVADLKAAGLNPVLAAGSAAQSSSPIHINAPEAQSGVIDRAAIAMGMLKQKADISATEAQKELMRHQMKLVSQQTDNALLANTAEGMRLGFEQERTEQDVINKKLENIKLNLENQIRSRDFEIIKKQGIRSDIAGSSANALQFKEFVQSTIGKLLKRGGAGASAAAEELGKW